MDTETIASITEKDWETVEFNWTTATEGTYNLRAYVTPKNGDPSGNNNATCRVVVRSAETVSVPTDFKWLQQGLSWVDDGYTVQVEEGSYYGQHAANKAVSVVGENVETTTIDGMIGLQPIVTVLVDGVTFSQLSFESGSYGINAAGFHQVAVSECMFTDCTLYGVATWSESTIAENTFEYCRVGAYVAGEGCTITGNTVLVNTDMVECYAGFEVGGGIHVSVDNNTITDLSVLHSWQAYGILFESVQIGFPWVTVTTSDSIAADNVIEGIMSGMDIAGEDNTIIDNRITDCPYWGIGISYSSYAVTTMVQNNIVTGCGYGIMSLQGVGNTIVDNIISNCTSTGMYLAGSCSSTSIVENSVEHCAKGIFEGRFDGNANTFHHNNFIDNAQQLETWGQANVWDDGAGEGNYWSDYTGADTDEDGVGETNLPWCGVDNYTLMHPWGSISNADTGLKYATVQKAIDASETQNGDTILVKAGNYSEQVILWNRTGLVLRGEPGTVFRDYAGPTLNIHMSASGSTITGFTLVNCTLGIYVWNGANGNSINNNTILECSNGIELLSDSNNTVRDNTISDCNYGILLLLATGQNNLITRNSITDSNRGIYMIIGHGNTFTENEIEGNAYGIYLTGSGNVFYHNNVVGNNDSVYVTTNSANTWDDGYPSGGNYWSDYTGVDANQDGIGDTPYAIDALNQDRYPLMGPL